MPGAGTSGTSAEAGTGGAQAGTSGSAGTGISGGASGDGGVAGLPTAGSGGAAGSSGGSAGAAGSTWHAAIASAVTDEMLAAEYSTWKTQHVQACSDGTAVVKKDGGSVVSEGIAYGMLLSVASGDRELFDGLWNYYLDHVDPNGLMNWATGICDPAGNNNANAATDGDLDAAMALVQAEARWPGSGYLTSAEELAGKIVTFETEVCDGRAILRPGDEFGGCSDTSSPRINPSYFSPGYYRVFSRLFPAQAERWDALLAGTYELYPLYQARMDGLVPDWSAVDGSDWYGAGYSYDACRTPWRVMVDYAWSGDARARTFLENVNQWVATNGLVGSHPENSAFVGAKALASAVDQAAFDSAVATWLASNGDDMPYFQNTLRVLYLYAAAGKFLPGL
jgi:endo-1,4-beta-D-glucanase Y